MGRSDPGTEKNGNLRAVKPRHLPDGRFAVQRFLAVRKGSDFNTALDAVGAYARVQQELRVWGLLPSDVPGSGGRDIHLVKQSFRRAQVHLDGVSQVLPGGREAPP